MNKIKLVPCHSFFCTVSLMVFALIGHSVSWGESCPALSLPSGPTLSIGSAGRLSFNSVITTPACNKNVHYGFCCGNSLQQNSSILNKSRYCGTLSDVTQTASNSPLVDTLASNVCSAVNSGGNITVYANYNNLTNPPMVVYPPVPNEPSCPPLSLPSNPALSVGSAGRLSFNSVITTPACNKDVHYGFCCGNSLQQNSSILNNSRYCGTLPDVTQTASNSPLIDTIASNLCSQVNNGGEITIYANYNNLTNPPVVIYPPVPNEPSCPPLSLPSNPALSVGAGKLSFNSVVTTAACNKDVHYGFCCGNSLQQNSSILNNSRYCGTLPDVTQTASNSPLVDTIASNVCSAVNNGGKITVYANYNSLTNPPVVVYPPVTNK